MKTVEKVFTTWSLSSINNAWILWVKFYLNTRNLRSKKKQDSLQTQFRCRNSSSVFSQPAGGDREVAPRLVRMNRIRWRSTWNTLRRENGAQSCENLNSKKSFLLFCVPWNPSRALRVWCNLKRMGLWQRKERFFRQTKATVAEALLDR